MEAVMLLARIENNVVRELVDVPDNIDLETAFHPSLRFVRVAPTVKQGASWDGKTFTNPVEITETKLPKDALKLRALRHRRLLMETAIIKVGERDIGIDLGILAAISLKIQLIDAGIIKQPVQFRLADGYAALMRSDLADLQRAIAVKTEELFAAEAEVIAAIDNNQISTQQQIEAAFPIGIGRTALPDGIE
jgi:hypothetical protein